MSPDNFLLIGPGVLAALSVPLILKVVPRNRIYGFRTPKTMATEALWYRANFFAACFVYLRRIENDVAGGRK